MLFAQREPLAARPVEPAHEALYDAYIKSRDPYKRELLEELIALSPGGPILEVCGGYGTLAGELLARTTVPLSIQCESEAARMLCSHKLRLRRLAQRVHLLLGGDDKALRTGSRFSLIYSVNRLHLWAAPAQTILRLYRLLKPGGTLVINDLRRDADPYITEYIIREMSDAPPEAGRFPLYTFLTALRSAYTSAEVASLLGDTGLAQQQLSVDCGDAMTVTIKLRKGSRT